DRLPRMLERVAELATDELDLREVEVKQRARVVVARLSEGFVRQRRRIVDSRCRAEQRLDRERALRPGWAQLDAEPQELAAAHTVTRFAAERAGEACTTGPLARRIRGRQVECALGEVGRCARVS